MKLNLIFIGHKFLQNKPLVSYIIRGIEKENDNVNSIIFYEENDNSLFLLLESQINSKDNLFIITTKQNFSTVGKLICTITADNQILQGSTLIPKKSKEWEDGSYLLEYNQSLINVLHIDEMQKLPKLFITSKEAHYINIFDEREKSLELLLKPIAQTYEISFELTTIIDGWIKVKLMQNRYGSIPKFIEAAKKLLEYRVIENENVISHIIERLSTQNKKLTFAESCTGGLLSYYFTKENGASKILDGSLVSYSNTLKENWLAVNNATLQNHGAVSQEVVREMSEGALNVTNANYSISISGIAGDSGGTDEKPVGTVFIGVRSENLHNEERFLFKGDRNYIQQQSALMAIKMLLLLDKKSFF